MGIARWGMGDPEWPKTAYAFGGKYAYEDDQETPNTLLAGFNYGDRELMFEVRGLLTGGEGTPQRRMGPGGGRGGRGAAPPAAPPDAPAPDHGRAGQQSVERPDRRPLLRHRRLGGDERPGLPGVQGREQRTHHGRASRARTAGRRCHRPAHAELPAGLQIAQH